MFVSWNYNFKKFWKLLEYTKIDSLAIRAVTSSHAMWLEALPQYVCDGIKGKRVKNILMIQWKECWPNGPPERTKAAGCLRTAA